MRFMLLMYSRQEDWDAVGAVGETAWSREALQELGASMEALNKELATAGELLDTGALAAPSTATVVRARPGGFPEVAEGRHPDTGPGVLVWYWVVDCAGRERAIEIAARASAVPGRGGSRGNTPVEVRPMVDEAPVRTV
ncbi:YciI family protein [Streptomyces sp. NPDC054796]